MRFAVGIVAIFNVYLLCANIVRIKFVDIFSASNIKTRFPHNISTPLYIMCTYCAVCIQIFCIQTVSSVQIVCWSTRHGARRADASCGWKTLQTASNRVPLLCKHFEMCILCVYVFMLHVLNVYLPSTLCTHPVSLYITNFGKLVKLYLNWIREAIPFSCTRDERIIILKSIF